MTETFRVLQVEDNPGDIVLLSKAVRRHDVPIDITAVRSGEAAMEKLYENLVATAEASESLAAVLLDLNLPGMSGADVLRFIAELPKLDHLTVAIMSSAPDAEGYDMTGIEERACTRFKKPQTLAGYQPIVERLYDLLQEKDEAI